LQPKPQQHIVNYGAEVQITKKLDIGQFATFSSKLPKQLHLFFIPAKILNKQTRIEKRNQPAARKTRPLPPCAPRTAHAGTPQT